MKRSLIGIYFLSVSIVIGAVAPAQDPTDVQESADAARIFSADDVGSRNAPTEPDASADSEPAIEPNVQLDVAADESSPAVDVPGEANPATPQETEVNDTDSFLIQGEYASLGSGSGSSVPQLGLQIVDLGNRRFQGVLLPGGLPGNGWDESTRIQLEGEADGSGATLHGSNYEVVVRDASALVTGDALDVQLTKVERSSPYAKLAPPSRAIVLFDGQQTAAFKEARVRDGLLQVGTELIPTFRDYHLHIEFRVPYMPMARGQGRGNSGVYLQSRYEVQVLDSFGLEGKFNECGALYRQRSPDLNMAFPPESWQTYDISFHAPRFDRCERKLCDARLTLLHNGVVVHNDVRIADKTGAGKPEGPQLLPTKLQDHGNPVQFRNIWLVELP